MCGPMFLARFEGPAMSRRLIPLAALALLLTAFAPMAQGDPIPNRDIVLQGDPSPPASSLISSSDQSGVAQWSPEPGRYALKLRNVQTLRVPAVARIEVGRMVMNTNTIQPGGRGEVAFMTREGGRLLFTVPRGARVRVVLTEGAPAPGPTGPRG